MVGPVVSIGPQGSSRYQTPDYSPITTGLGNLGAGLAQALAPPPPPLPAAPREREKDVHGVWRYVDTGEPVFGSSAGYEPPVKLTPTEEKLHAMGLTPGTQEWFDAAREIVTGDRFQVNFPDTPTPLSKEEKALAAMTEIEQIPRDQWTADQRRRYHYAESVLSLKPNESQNRAGRVADVGGRSLEILGETASDGEGTLFERLGDLTNMVGGIIGSKGQSDDFLRAQQAANDALNQILRWETGAEAKDSERQMLWNTYMPAIGDGPDVVQQKLAAFTDRIESARRQAGLGAGPVEAGVEPTKADLDALAREVEAEFTTRVPSTTPERPGQPDTSLAGLLTGANAAEPSYLEGAIEEPPELQNVKGEEVRRIGERLPEPPVIAPGNMPEATDSPADFKRKLVSIASDPRAFATFVDRMKPLMEAGTLDPQLAMILADQWDALYGR
ncbi:MAG: hypothetical protein OXD40_09450 [bacterium]|nr:hypothetical protein [bacterium]